MNPSEKGWLKDYIKFRKRIEQIPDCKKILAEQDSYQNDDEFLYCLLQPTGIMYGHPVQFPKIKHHETANWKEKDKMKVLLAESFVSSSLHFNAEQIQSKKDQKDIYYELINNVSSFILKFFHSWPKNIEEHSLDEKEKILNMPRH